MPIVTNDDHRSGGVPVDGGGRRGVADGGVHVGNASSVEIAWQVVDVAMPGG